MRQEVLLRPAPRSVLRVPAARISTDVDHIANIGTGTSAFSLASLLVCGSCDQPLQPSWNSRDERVYLFLCGCQRTVIDAAAAERLVRDRVEAASVVLVEDVPADRLGPVFGQLFAEVRVAASIDDLAFVWRI
ncbi:hypothetical protein [Dactylosporangium sp. NPDC048998]|uniref:hypothetical protein n=1 Tax=Dactylosporangium sp. NPDC048998 TaxID=3363976 RepID=UPI0037145668